MEDELTIRGSLEESTIPELIRSICKNKESGILTCFFSDWRKSIFIENGQVVFASSSSMDDRLGEFLLRTGRITVRSFLDATKLVRPGRKLGAVLCDHNAISADELVEGVREQARSIILSLFGSTKGNYELALKNFDTQEMILLNATPEEIIFEGVKTISSWSRISKGIGSFTSILLPSRENEKTLLTLNVKPEESHIFSLCEKGRFSVEEICSMSYLTNFETCRILWGYLLIGALEVQEVGERSIELPSYTPPSPEAEADIHELVESYNDVYAYLFHYTQERMGEDAERLVERAMNQVQGTMPNVTRNVRIDTYGRLDSDVLMRNLAPIPETGRLELLSAALEEVVYALLFEIGTAFGQEDQIRLTQEVQKIRKT